MSKQALKVYYDGSCPLCLAEINELRAMENSGSKLIFTDCASVSFDEAPVLREGVSRADLLRELHVREADGNWYRGVDASVRLYRRAGLLQLARVWEHPASRVVLNRLYPWIMRNRRWLSRLGLPVITEFVVRFYAKREQRCTGGACTIDGDK